MLSTEEWWGGGYASLASFNQSPFVILGSASFLIASWSGSLFSALSCLCSLSSTPLMNAGEFSDAYFFAISMASLIATLAGE